MILFGWRKRMALSMCCFIFLASISYLTGVINWYEGEQSRDFKSSKYLSAFSEDSLLRIFSKAFQTNLNLEGEDNKNLLNSDIKSINRRKFLDYLRKFVKLRIMDKLQSMQPNKKIKEKDFVGYFLYKWISESKLLITIKFKLLSFSEFNWYYDQFSVTLNG